jgi:hypothetical protein
MQGSLPADQSGNIGSAERVREVVSTPQRQMAAPSDRREWRVARKDLLEKI